MILTIVAAFFLLIGAFLIIVAAFGLFNMPDTFTRMSASTKASTLGAAAVFAGAGFYFRSITTGAQVFVTIIFLLATAPVGAHIIARAGYRKRRAPLYHGTEIDDLRDYYERDSVEEA